MQEEDVRPERAVLDNFTTFDIQKLINAISFFIKIEIVSIFNP